MRRGRRRPCANPGNALRWVSASVSSSGRANSWPIWRTRSSLTTGAPTPVLSAHAMEQTAVAYRERPAPDLPPMRLAIGRKEDELRPPDQVLRRHIADRRQHAAVLRVVAVVPHREVMPGRHFVDGRIVERTVVTDLDDRVLHRRLARRTRQ